MGQLHGVESVQVNVLTGSMKVRYQAELSPNDIIAAVEAAGYSAGLAQTEIKGSHENRELRRCFILSALLLVPLILIHHLWQGSISGIVQLILTLPLLWLNRRFFIKGTRSVLNGAANMDTLVALGATAAMTDGLLNFILRHRDVFYFESAGMILTLITFGKWMESRATGRTGAALEKLLTLLPQTATVLKNGTPCTIPADAVAVGDTLLVRAGERLPTDGTVLEGCSAADESALTGESLPVEKTCGCKVYAGSINGNGVLHVRADRTREHSALADIIRLVNDAAAGKAPIARLADRLSAVFVPIVIGLAMLTSGIWLVLGGGLDMAISRAIAVLVISCPCALGLATPVAIMVGTGKGAEIGILFRHGEALESLHEAHYLLLDKTGTLTTGKPAITDILPAPGHHRDELMQLAADTESAGHHPLAEAVQTACAAYSPHAVKHHIYRPGRGVIAEMNGKTCAAGNAALMRELGVPINESAAEQLARAGKTPIFFANGGECIGLMAVADTLKPDSRAAVAAMQKQGLQVLMLTGDHPGTAQAVAAQAGITEVRAGLLPQDKEAFVRHLQSTGKRVVMIGDGINDAPALTRADVGIAIGAGTDIALESADVILVRSSLTDAVDAIRLSHTVIQNIRQNLFWALLYNCLAIPLAAGVFYPVLGWQLHPAIAAAAMGLSSCCVVCNALRLRRFQPTPPPHMNTITIKVEGMMCPHCEAHVTRALLALPGIVDCKASHQNNEVVITLQQDIPLAEIHAVITAQGYQVR